MWPALWAYGTAKSLSRQCTESGWTIQRKIREFKTLLFFFIIFLIPQIKPVVWSRRLFKCLLNNASVREYVFNKLHLQPRQNPARPEEHNLLQCHRPWWDGGVGFCMENVPEHNCGFGSIVAQRSHDLHQTPVAFEQVSVEDGTGLVL